MSEANGLIQRNKLAKKIRRSISRLYLNDYISAALFEELVSKFKREFPEHANTDFGD